MAGLGDTTVTRAPRCWRWTGRRFDVQVRLRGHFQPIDGRYHWYGRIDAHEGAGRLLGSGRASAVLTTAEGSAPVRAVRAGSVQPVPGHRHLHAAVPRRGQPRPAPAAGPAGPAAAGPAGDPARDRRVGRRAAGQPGARRQAGRTGPRRAAARPCPGGRHRRRASAGSARRSGCTRRASTDFVHPGARHRGRRHLAGQHLPGLRLRRALAPVLVLVRAEPGLVAQLLPAAGDLASTWKTSPIARAAAEASGFGTEVTGPLGRGPGALAAADQPRRHHRRRPDLRRGPAVRAVACPTSRGWPSFPGEVFHSARVEPRLRPEGKRVAVVGTGASAIQIVPEIQPEVKPPGAVPAHPRLGRCRAGTAGSPSSRSAVPARPAGPAAGPARHLHLPRVDGRRLRQAPADAQGRPAAGAAQPGQVRLDDPGCGPS